MAQNSITLTTSRLTNVDLNAGDAQLIEIMSNLLKTTRIEIQMCDRPDGTQFLHAACTKIARNDQPGVIHGVVAEMSANSLRDLMLMMAVV